MSKTLEQMAQEAAEYERTKWEAFKDEAVWNEHVEREQSKLNELLKQILGYNPFPNYCWDPRGRDYITLNLEDFKKILSR